MPKLIPITKLSPGLQNQIGTGIWWNTWVHLPTSQSNRDKGMKSQQQIKLKKKILEEILHDKVQLLFKNSGTLLVTLSSTKRSISHIRRQLHSELDMAN